MTATRNTSVVYTRWGKKECPNDSEQIHSGKVNVILKGINHCMPMLEFLSDIYPIQILMKSHFVGILSRKNLFWTIFMRALFLMCSSGKTVHAQNFEI